MGAFEDGIVSGLDRDGLRLVSVIRVEADDRGRIAAPDPSPVGEGSWHLLAGFGG